jgi:hypothetical protein
LSVALSGPSPAIAALTRRPDRLSDASASIRTSMAFTWRNSPTQTMSAASASDTGADSASPTPLWTTRTIAGGLPISARNRLAA